MSALHKHIQLQQDKACNLSGLLEALAIIDREFDNPLAVAALISVCLSLASELNHSLDSTNLPEVGA